MPRRLAAVMSADVDGFTRLVRIDEDGTLQRLRALLASRVVPAVEANGGRVIKTLGDGFLAEFVSAVDAVSAAMVLQDRVTEAEAARPEDQRIRFRVGINLGDILIEDDDIFGDGVNLASRVQAISEPDGICVSGLVHDAIRHRGDLFFRDLGERTLKNVDRPVRVFAVQPAPAGARAAEAAAAAADLAADDFLREEAATPAGKPSIAILPFRNLTGSADNEFLADGLRLGIQAALVRLSGLFLVNAAVINRYKTAPASAEAAAAELDVRYVLEGALQAAAGRVRILLQLTDAVEHRVVWAERYDRAAEDIFAIEDEIIAEVIAALGLTLVMGEGTRAVAAVITGRAAREQFYRAMSNLYIGTRDSNAAARECFLYLYEKEGETHGAPGNIAVTHWLDYMNDWTDDPSASFGEAEAWAERASGYPKNNGLGPTVLANVRVLERRHDEAVALGREGVRSRTSCPMSHGGYANILTFCGDTRIAIPHARHALSLEKAYPSWMVNLLAAAYRDHGDLERAARAAAQSLKLNPLDIDARLILCSVEQSMGNPAAARRLAEDVIALDPAFSLSRYAERQPYRDETRLGSVLEPLGEAGLKG